MDYLTRNDNCVIIVINSPRFRVVIIGKAVNVDLKFLTIKIFIDKFRILVVIVI